VTSFFGRYEHSLDDKGRVVLPTRFRPYFQPEGFLTLYHDGCVALWPPEEFGEAMVRMRERAAGDAGERRIARAWFSDAYRVLVDKQGRIPIPARLRSQTELEGDILIIGFDDHIELWSPRMFEEKHRAEIERFAKGEG